MSTVQGFTPASIAQALDDAFIPQGYYVEMGCIAVIIYEYLLTFTAERHVIRGRKSTIPSILFILNRYCLLLYALSTALWGFVSWDTDAICTFPGSMQTIVGISLGLISAVLLALRIHAINHRSWFWTLLIFFLACLDVPSNLAILVMSRYASIAALGLPWPGCAQTGPRARVWSRVAVATIACAYAVSILVIGITWYRTARLVFTARKFKSKMPITYYLLRDGTVFFVIALIGNSIMIYLELTRNLSLGMIAITLQSIMTSRFILNLRSLDGPTATLETMTLGPLETSDIRFAPPASLSLGNIGAPLDVDGENDLQYDDEYDEDEDEDTQDILGTTHTPELGMMSEYHAVRRSDSFDV